MDYAFVRTRQSLYIYVQITIEEVKKFKYLQALQSGEKWVVRSPVTTTNPKFLKLYSVLFLVAFYTSYFQMCQLSPRFEMLSTLDQKLLLLF